MVVRESILSALIEGRTSILDKDISKGICFVAERGSNKELGIT
jgi:hypothetical protein